MANVKLIVAGTRIITESRITFMAIKEWCSQNPDKSIGIILSGMTKGPDTHAIEYANQNHIPYVEFPPDWDLHGKKAGILRNIEMAKDGDELIAVYDGKSKGTEHMIDTMLRLNKPVWIYDIHNLPIHLKRLM